MFDENDNPLYNAIKERKIVEDIMFLYYFNISILYNSCLTEQGVVIIEYRKVVCAGREGTQI